MAGSYQIRIEQGATFQLMIDWKDANGTLVPLAGYSAKMQVRNVVGGTLIVEASTTNSRITFPQAGRIQIVIDHTTTNGLSPQTAVYDLILTDPSNVVTRLLEGPALIAGAVTQ